MGRTDQVSLDLISRLNEYFNSGIVGQMDRRSFLLTGSAGFASVAFAQPVKQAVRSALVIGNVSYSPLIGALRNPGNDAHAIARALGRHDFKIYGDKPLIDADRTTLMASVRGFAKQFENGDQESVGFFYFSGHGASKNDSGNCLFPIIDWPVERGPLDESIWDDTVDVSWLFEVLSAIKSPQIVCIDACRNTLNLPSAKKSVSGNGATFSDIRGLTRVVSQRSANMFISFSTYQGSTASDGRKDEQIGPYARSLSERLEAGRQKVRDLFEHVRLDVTNFTSNEQEPMSFSRLQAASVNLSIHSEASVPSAEHAPVRANLSHAVVLTNPSTDVSGSMADAEMIHAALEESGFQSILKTNSTRSQFMKAILELRDRMTQAGSDAVGVVFFNGYGGSFQGDNILLPPDVLRLTDIGAARFDSIRLSDVIEILGSIQSAGIILVLDCEDPGSQIPAKGGQRGLDTTYGSGNDYVILSAQPGTHGNRRNGRSIFAAAFAAEILSDERRGIDQLLDAVSHQVRSDTNGIQQPYLQSRISAPIYFRRDADR